MLRKQCNCNAQQGKCFAGCWPDCSRFPLIMALGLFLSFMSTSLLAQDTNRTSRSLDEITFSALSSNKVQIRLTMTGEQAETQPLSFTIDNPARIAFDFPDTASSVAKSQPIGIGIARRINVVESKGRTRVVLSLDKLVPYTTVIDGHFVYITLDNSVPSPAGEMVAMDNVLEQDGTVPQVKVQQRSIENIDFRRGTKGEGRVIVTLSDPSTVVNIRDEAGKVKLDFLNTSLPEELQQRMDVVDFATPVSFVDSYTQDENVQILVTAEGEFEHLAYQSNERFTLEIKPLVKDDKKEEGVDEKDYSGERLSLNFQDIEVRAVLQLIADFTSLNLVTSDTVKGSVTLRLQNVPWDQALDIILKTKGLAMRQSGNVMLVAPSEEIAAREKQEYESQKQIEDLVPLRTELIQVNYAKAGDISELLKAQENSLLSERGNVTIDERTNTLLIQDTIEKLDEIRKLVHRLDIPVRQVLIESRVVIANDDFSRGLGVRFGASSVTDNGSSGLIGSSGSLAATDSMVTNAPLPVPNPSLDDRLNVDLPVIGTAGKIAFAILGSDYLVDLELSAMQAEGRGEVVSSPRVITSNQAEALIEQGVEIPYQEASSSGATTVAFKKAVLKLQVKPQITPDDRIIMELKVNKDSVGEVFLGVPSINTREVSTEVLVNNGETVVLGGIYEQTRSNEVDSVPFLGSLPFVGALFRQTRKVDDKAELLIFVTPKILKESLSLR
ncbi:MAG: type IV pilus secretin PilQ [Gammaproteobacteria bacterium]